MRGVDMLVSYNFVTELPKTVFHSKKVSLRTSPSSSPSLSVEKLPSPKARGASFAIQVEYNLNEW